MSTNTAMTIFKRKAPKRKISFKREEEAFHWNLKLYRVDVYPKYEFKS